MFSVPPGLAVASVLVAPGTQFTSINTPMLNALRPFRGFNAINVVQPWFNSNYHSLQTSFQRRLKGSSVIYAANTWSKALTDNQTDRSTAPQNFYDRRAEYGRSQLDRTHVFNLNFVYELPWFREQQGLGGRILGGWQLSGIYSANSGSPLTVTTSGVDPAGLGILGSSQAGPRPDMIGEPNKNAPHTFERWFNTQAFANVPAGVIRPGNAGRGVVRAPGYNRLDFSVFKNIRVTEDMRFQFRAESFNTLNHTNPSTVGTALATTSTFGRVTATRDPRIIQLALKFYF
jgi:hypothetical protein